MTPAFLGFSLASESAASSIDVAFAEDVQSGDWAVGAFCVQAYAGAYYIKTGT